MRSVEITDMGGAKRNSSLELLRIISMWLIVFYHFHLHVLSVDGELFYKAIMIPLHIGVPLFVLISGYFGINASVKGFSKFVVKVGFYSILLLALALVLRRCFAWAYPVSIKQVAGGVFFFSRTNNLWFVRSYIILYLISPFWNKAISEQTFKQRIGLIAILFFVSFWFYLIGQVPEVNDHSILTMLTIYTIGRTIRDFNLVDIISPRKNLMYYCIVTILITAIYILLAQTKVAGLAWICLFKYNSPFLLLSAALFFMLFARKEYYKPWINYVSTSTFAVYLISENSLTNLYIYDIVENIQQSMPLIPMYVALLLFVTVIFCFCILVDKITSPLQTRASVVVERIINKSLRHIHLPSAHHL